MQLLFGEMTIQDMFCKSTFVGRSAELPLQEAPQFSVR